MENDIWLRCRNDQVLTLGDQNKEIKWKLCSFYNEKLYTADGTEPLLSIVKYFKNNNGEWERSDYGFYYITLRTLLTDFILIDGPFEQELNKLTEQLADIWKNNINNSLNSAVCGMFDDTIKPEDAGVEVAPPQAEERNINDGE